MILYDARGNQIEVGGGAGSGGVAGKVGIADFSEEIVSKVIVVDENTEVVNQLDISKVETGRFETGTNTNFNKYYTGFRTSDYIPVRAGQTYVAQSWDTNGNTGYDSVVLYDVNKAPLKKLSTSGNTTGTIRYCIFTPDYNGFARYAYTYTEAANPMVYIGLVITDTFVEYTGETLTGEPMYKIAADFKDMVRRDVEPSNLNGKTVYMIGDSNSDNWSNGTAKELEKRYGCTVVGLGKYGAKWATTTDTTDTDVSNAIGQWNKFVSIVGINEDEYLFPDDVALLFMMGTNAGCGIFDATNEDVTTPGGAINYILKRAKYYGRKIPIGVFLPWACTTKDQLKAAAEYYRIPYFDIASIIADDTPTKGLTRPDGSVVSQNYITDGGNHLAANGWEMFKRIAHPWIAYEI